jgi:predicted glycosyltransferase involved in capsule biosynthesis
MGESHMNSIAIIQTYYDDPNYLQQAIKSWNSYEIPISVILIDDGSPQYPASEVLSQFTFSSNVNVSLYKVTEDIGFNSHGCRNLGAAVSKSDWLIFLDIDHFLDSDQLNELYKMKLSEDSWYGFTTIHNGNNLLMGGGPSNTFMCTKTMYEQGGGYDESYTPYHYGDRQFLAMMKSKFDWIKLENIIIDCRRAGRKMTIDANISKPIYDNDTCSIIHPPRNLDAVKFHDKRLNFKWVQLL